MVESKINVSVRIKPLSEAEQQNEKNRLWTVLGDGTVMNLKTKEMFSFDNVFSDNVSTEHVFDSSVKENVLTAI